MIKSLNLRNDIDSLPVFFSQVREDPILDKEIIQNNQYPCKVLMIASGGDTLCKLASLPEVSSIDAVDANPAQIYLSKFKLALLKFSTENRLRILGHEAMDPDIRRQIVSEICRELAIPNSALGPENLVSKEGVDFSGRYEQLFKGIQKEFKSRGIRLSDIYSNPNLIDEVFKDYFDLDLLIKIFGHEATQNPVQLFSEHFIERTKSFLRNEESLSSPFINQMLFGSFGSDPYEWHKLRTLKESDICNMHFHQNFMLDYLKNSPDSSYDFIHLSNILDWLSEDEASLLLSNSFRSLKPGGRVIIRQLNSTLDIKELGKSFQWNEKKSEELTAKDKSFFYRKILLGEKKL